METIIRKLAGSPERSILVLGLILMLAGNWILPMTDRDEASYSEQSREMLERGDYVVPWFNGRPVYEKPIMIYWCQSASYRLLGANDFAARLPSALFTVATALLLVRWGRKAADAQTGFIAGALFIAGLHVAIIGRSATTDPALIFFFMLAVWSGWELTRPENPSRMRWWWLFYASLGLIFLTKGPLIVLPVGGVVLGRLLRRNSFRLPVIETIAGGIVSLAIVACWGIPAYTHTQGEYWRVFMGQHVVGRSMGAMQGHGASGQIGYVLLLPLYFLTFTISFLPWTLRKPEEAEPWLQKQNQKGGVWNLWVPVLGLFLSVLHIPIKICRWWPERRRDDLGWYLLAQALIVFVLFSLVKTKLPHYTMPAFPCLALWLALQLRFDANSFAWFQRRFAVMVVVILVLMLGLAGLSRNYLLTPELWQATQLYVRPETKLGSFGYTEPSLVWKFRSVMTNIVVLDTTEKDAKNFLTNTPPFILILPTKDVALLPDTNGLQIQVHGLNLGRSRMMDLTAIVRQR
jgi:4-amino-4-deoxy-L-arabinose transferase-like glycosyltransferase